MKWHARLAAGARIIVAEDDAAMRSIVVEALRKDGYRVSSVSDGGELLAELGDDAARFDLIISDIRMPVRDGLAIIDHLRKNQCTTPVILMTAFGDDAARDSARSLNATLLDKPFELYDLRTAVLNVL